MKREPSTPAEMIQKLAKEIIASAKEYQAAQKGEETVRSKTELLSIESQKGACASDMLAAVHQMLSEIGCVLSIENIIKPNEYYVIDKKNF